MSVWSKENCIITNKGNQALTEISAKGGTMTFDSVWTCSVRVAPEELYNLTDLPQKVQKMTLVRYTQVSSGYTINVQVTNEGLNAPYPIEMVGVYMKMNGFNDGNPFLYMVLLTDEGTADRMTNISRSTYKYAIYLYHTNKAILNISLNSQDYVASDTYEADINRIESDLRSGVYHVTRKTGNTDESNFDIMYTEDYENNPLVLPSENTLTKFPVIIIHNYTGTIGVNEDEGLFAGVNIDGLQFKLAPYNYVLGQTNLFVTHTFNNEDLICTVLNDDTLRVMNFFNTDNYLVKDSDTYANFNALPKESGVYSLSGSAINSPVQLTDEYVWTCLIVKSLDTYIVLAVNNCDNSVYRRYLQDSDASWSSASTWVSIGGGGGIQTATATFVSSSNTDDPSQTYLRIMRSDTTNALKSGDVIMCTLTSLSSLTGNSTITVRYLDSTTSITSYIYKTDNTTKLPCCQLSKYFLLEYDGKNFHLLSPPNTAVVVTGTEPTSSDGKHGDIWYVY